MKKILISILFIVCVFSLKAQIKGYTVEATDSLKLNGDSFTGTTKVNAADLNLATEQYVIDATGIDGFDSLTLNPNIEALDFNEYTIFADSSNMTFTVYLGESEISPQLFLENYVLGYNNTGSTIVNGTPVYLDSSAVSKFGNFKLAIANDITIAAQTVGIATHDIEDGSYGFATKFGLLTKESHGYTIGLPLYVSPTSAGNLTEVRPLAPDYNVRIGGAISDSIIFIDIIPFDRSDTEVNIEGILNGIITQKQAIRDTVISNVLYFETYNEEDPSRSLPYVAGGTRYNLNTLTNTGTNGYARVTLTFGTVTSALANYIYIDNTGTPTLTANTTGFPSEGIRLATCNVFDEATHLSIGFASFQRFNNAVDGTEADGLWSKATKRIRLDGSKYETGIDPTVTIVTDLASVDSLKVSTTSGIISQFNSQSFQVQTGNRYLWLNSPTGEQVITDLNQANLSEGGVDLHGGVNRRYGLNIFAIQNSGDFNDFLAVTTPTNFYSDDQEALDDINTYAVTNVPSKYEKVATRLFRLPVNYTTSDNGTITNLLGAGGFQEERGFSLGSGGGGSGSGASVTDYSDAEFTIYNSADPTKLMTFDASAITTGNTRALTIPDASGTIALKEDSLALGTTQQIPYMNATNDDFIYSAGFEYTGAILNAPNIVSEGGLKAGDAIVAEELTPTLKWSDTDGDDFTAVGNDNAWTFQNLTDLKEYLKFSSSHQTQFPQYGIGTYTGTAAKWLAVTSTGLIIEENAPSVATDTTQTLTAVNDTITFDYDAGSSVEVSITDSSVVVLSNVPDNAEGNFRLLHMTDSTKFVKFVLSGTDVYWRGEDHSFSSDSASVDIVSYWMSKNFLNLTLGSGYTKQED